MMTHTAWRRLGPALLLAAGALFYLGWTGRYDGKSGLVPGLVAWATLVLTLLDLVASSDSAAGRVLSRLLAGGASTEAQGEAAGRRAWRSELAAVAWIAGFVAAVALVGFLPALPVYVTLFMVLKGGRPWLSSVYAALLTTALIFLVFEVLWNYTVFRGFLFE